MTIAASILPELTSRRAVSTNRAKNGTVPIVSETQAAKAPIDVPVIARANGIRAIIRMANGMDRVIFTMTSDTIRLVTRMGRRPPGALV